VRAAERRLAAATEAPRHCFGELVFPQVSVSGFVGFLAGRGSTFFTGDSTALASSRLVVVGVPIWVERALEFAGSSAAADEALASYEETVLRALEETESSFASYHAQQVA